MIAKTNIPNIDFEQTPQIPLAQAELHTPKNRHSPRRSELLVNAPVVVEPTIELPIIPVPEAEAMPIQPMAQETVGSRIKNRFSKARNAIKNVFNKESTSPVEQVRARKRTIAGVAGSIAVGLVMTGLPGGSTAPAPAIEAMPTTPTTTAVADSIQFPSVGNIAAEAGKSIQDLADAYQFVAEHPAETKQLFDWITVTVGEHPGITDAQMSQQFHNYVDIQS